MNDTSGSKILSLLFSDHHRLASCTSNDINTEQVPSTCSVFTISPLSSQASSQNEKWFLTPFSKPKVSGFESHLNGAVKGTATPNQPGGHR